MTITSNAADATGDGQGQAEIGHRSGHRQDDQDFLGGVGRGGDGIGGEHGQADLVADDLVGQRPRFQRPADQEI